MTKPDVLILTPKIINCIRRQTIALATAPLIRPIYICDSCGEQFGDTEVDVEPTPFGTIYTTTKSHCANPLLWAEEWDESAALEWAESILTIKCLECGRVTVMSAEEQQYLCYLAGWKTESECFEHLTRSEQYMIGRRRCAVCLKHRIARAREYNPPWLQRLKVASE